MPLNPPAFSPPAWPRLGRAPDASVAVGGLAPAPVEIPICWLTQPVKLRLDTPFTTAQVDDADVQNDAALAQFGDWPFTATLTTATAADSYNLAHWTVTYRAEPRMRSPRLSIDMLSRTDEEKLRLLGIERGQRILLTGVPAEFPEGAASLVVSGIGNEIGIAVRKIHFTTTAVIGVEPGTPGPWFRLGSSVLGGTDIVPF